MKLLEIINEGAVGDFAQGVRSGYSAIDNLSKTSPKGFVGKLKKKFTEPVSRTALDSINRRELKKAVQSVIDEQPLDSRQREVLKTFLNNL